MARAPAAALVQGSPGPEPRAEIAVPGSKSFTNRALVLAALTEGPVEITGSSESEDSAAMLDCLAELGISVERDGQRLVVRGDVSQVEPERHYRLDAALAGTTIRFILALGCTVPGTKMVFGKAPLNARPIGDLVDGLRQLGADIEYLEEQGRPPLWVTSSRLTGNVCRIRGDVSSQYFSAILMVAPQIGGVTIDVEGDQTSKPYIDMTLASMAAFGVRGVRNEAYRRYVVEPGQHYACSSYAVEGDWSCAGYFLALAALTERTITIRNLNPASSQADRQLSTILERMGSDISYGPESVTIVGRGVQPIEVDMNDCPDQIQTVAVLAAFAQGVTRITGASTLRDKETDRTVALERELARMEIVARAEGDTLIIYGGEPQPASIQTYGDHRMAMSFAVAASKIDGVVIGDPAVVAKSYPDFWDTLGHVGARVTMKS